MLTMDPSALRGVRYVSACRWPLQWGGVNPRRFGTAFTQAHHAVVLVSRYSGRNC